MADEKEKTKGPTVQSVAEEAIRGGKTNEEALAAVVKKFPDAKTGINSINWYRHNLRSSGEKGIKTARELKKERAPAKEPKVKKAPKAKSAPKKKAAKKAA